MKQENSKCLVLNADYTPLAIIGWRRAIIWSIKNDYNTLSGIQVIDFYKNDYIRCTNNKKLPIPAVARMATYHRVHGFSVNFSRKNLFTRDNMTCQYCGCIKDKKELTYDHVIPKSQWDHALGSPTNWTNIVTACVYCNRKKGNRTPTQANMPLLSIPAKPNKNIKYLPLSCHLDRIKNNIPSEWLVYLPPSYIET